MKKIYSTLALSALTMGAFGQFQDVVVKKTMRGEIVRTSSPSLRIATDTLGIGFTVFAQNAIPIFAPSNQVYNFGYTGGGYVYGVNIGPNLNEVAQGYEFSGTVAVEGVIFWMIGKYQGPSHTPTVAFNIRAYNWSATGALDLNAGGSPIPIPGPTSVAATVPFLFDNVDTNFLAYNTVMFPSPATFTDNFAVGAEYAAVKAASDTIGFACDAPMDAFGLNYAFHKYSGSFYASNTLFGDGDDLDNNIAIFPIVSTTSVGLGEQTPVFYGMQMSQNYPNPVSNNTTINYSLDKATSKATMKIMDINGRIVGSYELGAKNAGSYDFNYSASNIESGSYLFMLTTDMGSLTTRFNVVK